MRALRRNKQVMFYSIPTGKVPIIVDGMETGEYEESYSEPVKFEGCLGSQLKDALARSWGSDNSNNYAILVVSKEQKDEDGNYIDFPNGTLIYRLQTPSDGNADYTVDGVMDEELNETSYYLRKRT